MGAATVAVGQVPLPIPLATSGLTAEGAPAATTTAVIVEAVSAARPGVVPRDGTTAVAVQPARDGVVVASVPATVSVGLHGLPAGRHQAGAAVFPVVVCQTAVAVLAETGEVPAKPVL